MEYTNIEMYNHKIKTSFLARAFGTSGLQKTGFNLEIVILYPRKTVYNTMREITIIFVGLKTLGTLISAIVLSVKQHNNKQEYF